MVNPGLTRLGQSGGETIPRPITVRDPSEETPPVTQTAAPAEPRILKDAAEPGRLPEIESRAGNAAERKMLTALKQALKIAEVQPERAARMALKAAEMAPNNATARNAAGVLLERTGRLSAALEQYEASWRLDPDGPDIYLNLGLAAWKLDMLEGAERFFRIHLSKNPERVDGAINLAGVLRDKGDYADAIEILRRAIYTAEDNTELWNSLGTVLLESGDPEQAETFYRESLRLDEGFARGWHNLAFSLDLRGRLDEALQAFDTALESPASKTDEMEMRHGRALSLLASGDLQSGWDEYDVRLDPDYREATVFKIGAPRWRGEAGELAGKRVLLVGEQGLGDEVLFMNACAELIEAVGLEGQVLIACEPRLVSLFARSFPQAKIGPHITKQLEGRKFRFVAWLEREGGADLWLPMGDMAGLFRRSLDAFPDHAFLTPDPERVAAFKAQLDAMGDGPKLGLVWKSMLMAGKRAKYFSPFEQWRPVLQTPGAVFVNLQYGDTDAELARAQKDYGVEIHQIEGLDLKNDLEGVAALGAALDLAMGPMNASTNLAAAAGGEVWFLAYKSHWPLLGSGALPWYAGSRAFSPEEWGDWTGAMNRMAGALGERMKKMKAA